MSNPNDASVSVEARGSGYDQAETGGLGLGRSPDYRVSEEWIRERPQTVVAPTTIPPNEALAIWQETVPNGAEVDGRFRVTASGPVYVSVIAAPTADVTQAVNLAETDAPGEIAVSGTPPPPFGREAGVYAFDTWRGEISAAVPAAGAEGRRVGFMINTATGGGLTPVQAFPALTHYTDSAAEAVGMYGNVYDLSIALRHDGRDGTGRQVRVVFASLATANISRYWDGIGLVEEQAVVLRHTPTGRTTTLATVTLAPGETKKLRFRAMVPGLASIPQALYLESR